MNAFPISQKISYDFEPLSPVECTGHSKGFTACVLLRTVPLHIQTVRSVTDNWRQAAESVK